MMLDVPDHIRNWTVFGFGLRDAIFEAAACCCAEIALARIDMRRHQGAYPRIGSVDVFLVRPFKDATIAEAVQMSVRSSPEQVAARFKIPGTCSASPRATRACRDIDNIREWRAEGFAEKIKEPAGALISALNPFRRTPESAIIIGARHPLISFSVAQHHRMEAARAVC